jgi:hypothetical protein
MNKVCEFCNNPCLTCLDVEFLVPKEETKEEVIMEKVLRCVCDDCLMAIEMGQGVSR